MIRAALVLALVACTDPDPSPPDAMPDAEIEEVSPCCAFLPDDENAARQCFLDQPGTWVPGTCGVFICQIDGVNHRVNFCIPD